MASYLEMAMVVMAAEVWGDVGLMSVGNWEVEGL